MHLRMVKEHAFDVAALQAQLEAHSEVWDTIRHRTEHPQSPHREVSDIWVHYNPIENFAGDMQAFNAEHTPEWYPVWEALPAARELAMDVMLDQNGVELGAVLITKIPAGCQVYPHVDQGWHARYFEKFAVQIHGHPRQAFHFEGEDLITAPGDLFWFDNAYPHWVTNDSDADRVTLIVCIRRH